MTIGEIVEWLKNQPNNDQLADSEVWEQTMQNLGSYLVQNGSNASDKYTGYKLHGGGNQWEKGFAFSGFPTDDAGITALINALMDADADPDRQQALRASLLDWLQAQNQRSYDRSQLEDQRAYNERMRDEERFYASPQMALQRLMATGLSHDAALKLLNGSAGSGGAASVIGASSPASSNLNAVPVGNAGGSTFANFANGASQIVDSLVQLANVGIDGYSAIKQGRLQAAQTQAIHMNNAANQYGSQFNSMYQTAVDRGYIDKSSIKSFDDARRAMASITPEQSRYISDYMNSDYDTMLSTPGALSVAADNFKQNNSASDSIAKTRQMFALAESYELNPKVLLTHMDLENATIQKIWSDIANETAMVDSNLDVNDAQINYLEAQTEQSKSETSLNQSFKRQKDLENRRIYIALHREEITQEDLDKVAIYDIGRRLQVAAKSSDPQVLENELNYIANNAKYRSSLMAFNAMRYTHAEQMLSDPDCQQLMYWSIFFDDLNLGQLYQTKYKGKNPWIVSKNPEFQSSMKNFILSFGLEPM